MKTGAHITTWAEYQNTYFFSPKHGIGGYEFGLATTLSICLFLSPALTQVSWAQNNATPGHLSKILELTLKEGKIPKVLKFPIYEKNSVQYFSAGLGKEERSLTYPPYSLKLIFVQGERAFLAGITVQISDASGKHLLTIPGEEVQGPWLFVDLPKGKYSIEGTKSGGATIGKSVMISQEKTKTLHFRWP